MATKEKIKTRTQWNPTTTKSISHTSFVECVSPNAEKDNSCVTTKVRKNPLCLRQALQFDFHRTMSIRRPAIAKLKKAFGCGSEWIARFKNAIARKKLTDWLPKVGFGPTVWLVHNHCPTTTENEHVSDGELPSFRSDNSPLSASQQFIELVLICFFVNLCSVNRLPEIRNEKERINRETKVDWWFPTRKHIFKRSWI